MHCEFFCTLLQGFPQKTPGFKLSWKGITRHGQVSICTLSGAHFPIMLLKSKKDIWKNSVRMSNQQNWVHWNRATHLQTTTACQSNQCNQDNLHWSDWSLHGSKVKETDYSLSSLMWMAITLMLSPWETTKSTQWLQLTIFNEPKLCSWEQEKIIKHWWLYKAKCNLQSVPPHTHHHN